MIEVYRGSVATWECDEMGHLNVRYYTQKAAEGVDVLFHRFGLGPSVLDGRGWRLELGDTHTRFLREARPGTALLGRAAPLALGPEGRVRIGFELVHALSGEIAAGMVIEARLVERAGGAPVPLPPEARARIEA
ncbi:MAG: thioesterase family protein, partial [Alphaproteobacteria bacterium]|nr:thioesterase family protein [Alphaproteobacteria bacterium]